MSKSKTACIVFLVLGIITHLILTIMFFNLNNWLARSVRLYNKMYGIINDLSLGAVLCYLVSYLIIKNEKDYYTNKFAALFVLSFPLESYSLLVLLPRANFLMLFRITFYILSISFIVIMLLYIFVNKVYNPLIKDIASLEKNVTVSTTMNVVLIIIYVFSLIANYVFIDYEIANMVLAIIIYLIFITCVIVFAISIIVDIVNDRMEEKNGTID
ncbi:MAG: hypothetical protein J6X93_01810 [Bacilli bacterium]|nr:hypothetical protein [Bacilli bacterium]